MLNKSLLPLLSLAVFVSAQQPLYAQCGGQGWTGSTSCVSGASCTVVNSWYSQCLPGGPTVAPTTTPTTTTSTTTPIITPTVTPTTTTTGPPPAGTCAPVPSSITLKANTKLPDPFALLAGGRVSTKAQFECRRAEISQFFQRYELGALPPPPQSVTASFSGSTLTVNVSDNGKSISFTATISGVPSGNGPFPAIIGVGGSSIPAQSGVASITFNNEDIASQASSTSRGNGKFYTLYGRDHSAGALMGWAWGVGRLIDGLEKSTGHKIDTTKLGVTGCSRNGKGAYVVGAFNPRIALTIPQESGSGGAGCWRISDAMKRGGIDTQTASQIVTENVWFSTLFNSYTSRVNDLLHDHHMLAALTVPRGLLIIENNGIDWLGPRSNWGCQTAGQKIYQAYGVPNNMGVSLIGGHNHCSFPSSQNSELAAYVNKFLKGDNSANTAVARNDGNGLGYVEADWVDWSIPTLS